MLMSHVALWLCHGRELHAYCSLGARGLHSCDLMKEDDLVLVQPEPVRQLQLLDQKLVGMPREQPKKPQGKRAAINCNGVCPVSYTHLTLPTMFEV